MKVLTNRKYYFSFCMLFVVCHSLTGMDPLDGVKSEKVGEQKTVSTLCSICLEDISSTKKSIAKKEMLPNCDHAVKHHESCLSSWLEGQSPNSFKGCPICRSEKHQVPLSLIEAVRREDEDLVFESLKVCKDVNLKDENGMTALMYASLNGMSGAVQSILDYGVNLDLQDIWGETALHKAVKKNNLDIVKQLVAFCADVNLQDVWEMTAIKVAQVKGFDEIEQILAKNLAFR